MNTFYQIVTKSDIDGNWIGFFTESSEIYKTHEEAYKRAEELATLKVSGDFNDHLTIQQYFINDEPVIEVFNSRINDAEIEYHIKKLTVV